MSLARLAPLAVATVLATPALAAAPIPLTFSAPPTGNVVQSNFFGISIELSFLDLYFGNDTNSIPPPIIQYLGAIRNHTGAAPVRMRLGGNSMDSATYAPSQTTPMINHTNPNSNSNDVESSFGDSLWEQLVAVGDAAGGGEYVVGLSLLDPSDPRAADMPLMYNAAKKALGNRLDTFLLGNEPDMYTNHAKRPQYTNYTAELYFSDFKNASSGLSNAADPAILGGPTVCCQWDLGSLIQEGYINQFKSQLKYISLQHYPQNYCWPPKHSFDLPYYGQHSQAVNLARWNSPGVLASIQAGLPVIMSEFNTASCGGIPGVSDTFLAGALWTLDYAMQLATVGYSAAYVHLREAGITYNPLSVTNDAWTTNPGYLALLVAPQVLGSGSPSRIIDINPSNSMSDPNQQQAGYATYDEATGAISRLTLFNFANVTASGNANTTFSIPKEVFANATALKLPNADPSRVTVKYLTAPNTNEMFDVSWAGMTYKGITDGKPVPDTSGRPGVAILDCSNGCSVDVPGPGLALVFVGPEPVTASSTANGTSANGTSAGTPGATGTGAPTDSTAKKTNNNNSNGANMSRPIGLFALAMTVFGHVVFA